MNWFVIGATFDVIGKIFTATAILIVHKHLIKSYSSHKIYLQAIKKMEKAQLLGETGIILIIIGYLINISNLVK